MPNHVDFTHNKVVALRKVYEEASRKGADSFKFEGNDYLVSYTRYLLEYLEPKFGITRRE